MSFKVILKPKITAVAISQRFRPTAPKTSKQLMHTMDASLKLTKVKHLNRLK